MLLVPVFLWGILLIKIKQIKESIMRRLKKTTITLMAVLLLCFAEFSAFHPFVVTAQAHQGRTDSRGGHHDYKNRSGLGSYHYHCGGYPPHLHTDGVCPYAGSSTGTQTRTVRQETPAKQTVIPDNIDLVFDYRYYADNNEDLKQNYGYDETKLLNHFIDNGMKEGRTGCSTFVVQVYKDNNPDLVEAYGDDLASYYTHYMNTGYSEGRISY